MLPVWKLKEFWIPAITGLVGTGVFAASYYYGLQIAVEPIVGAVLGVLGILLGFNNAHDKNEHGDK